MILKIELCREGGILFLLHCSVKNPPPSTFTFWYTGCWNFNVWIGGGGHTIQPINTSLLVVWLLMWDAHFLEQSLRSILWGILWRHKCNLIRIKYLCAQSVDTLRREHHKLSFSLEVPTWTHHSAQPCYPILGSVPLSPVCTVWDFILPRSLLFADIDLALVFFINPSHVSRQCISQMLISSRLEHGLFCSISLLCLKTMVYFYPVPRPHSSPDSSGFQRFGILNF